MQNEETIISITFGTGISTRSEDAVHNRNTAVTDILKHNSFSLFGEKKGPYSLCLSVADHRLNIEVKGTSTSLQVSLKPFRTLIKDYGIICESYHQAIANAYDPSKIEAIDMGRRGLHNEGAELFIELVEDKAAVDFETARRFFTLMYILHVR